MPFRAVLQTLAAVIILVFAGLGASRAAFGQGRCIQEYGTPACNTNPVKSLFEPTGWRTVALDQITFRVVEPQEAAFYAALLGWQVRSDDNDQVVMAVGTRATVVFRRAPPASFTPFAVGATPVNAIVEGLGFQIEPWNAATVVAELRKRSLTPVAANDGSGFESFHIKDPDGFDLQLGNGQGHARTRQTQAAGRLSAPAPFAPTGWQTVWVDHLSLATTNYKASASFYSNLLGWRRTYDEGSQHELLMGDVGDMIVRGGNPLDPEFGKRIRQQAGIIDHISFGIAPWDTDRVKAELEQRGLGAQVDTSDGSEIHVARYKSYHTTTPNGYDLQISSSTYSTRLNLAIAVKPRRVDR